MSDPSGEISELLYSFEGVRRGIPGSVFEIHSPTRRGRMEASSSFSYFFLHSSDDLVRSYRLCYTGNGVCPSGDNNSEGESAEEHKNCARQIQCRPTKTGPSTFGNYWCRRIPQSRELYKEKLKFN